MENQSLKNVFIWGFILWVVGYILGILLFPFVTQSQLGWFIMPFGIFLTLWVLLKKIKKTSSIQQYFYIAIVWTLIAIVCDYLFLVKVFNPADGYYKLDVYIYYLLTFILPILVGFKASHLK